MEKFGIFELLDTLSALTGTPDPPKSEAEPAAFSPPSPSDSSAPPQQNGQSAPPAESKNQAAFSAFLARHDAIAKKIDKK